MFTPRHFTVHIDRKHVFILRFESSPVSQTSFKIKFRSFSLLLSSFPVLPFFRSSVLPFFHSSIHSPVVPLFIRISRFLVLSRFSRQTWSTVFGRLTAGRLGFVRGDVYHLWHGELAQRDYYSRIRRFSPLVPQLIRSASSARDKNGLVLATPAVRAFMDAYFTKREVDAHGRHALQQPHQQRRPQSQPSQPSQTQVAATATASGAAAASTLAPWKNISVGCERVIVSHPRLLNFYQVRTDCTVASIFTFKFAHFVFPDHHRFQRQR